MFLSPQPACCCEVQDRITSREAQLEQKSSLLFSCDLRLTLRRATCAVKSQCRDGSILVLIPCRSVTYSSLCPENKVLLYHRLWSLYLLLRSVWNVGVGTRNSILSIFLGLQKLGTVFALLSSSIFSFVLVISKIQVEGEKTMKLQLSCDFCRSIVSVFAPLVDAGGSVS